MEDFRSSNNSYKNGKTGNKNAKSSRVSERDWSESWSTPGNSGRQQSSEPETRKGVCNYRNAGLTS